MAKLKNCFIDDQPDFYFKAEIDGVDYGLMRHLTADDFSFITRFADRKVMNDENGNPVMQKVKVKDEHGKETEEEQVQYDYDFMKLSTAYLLCAFGGTQQNGFSRRLGQEGWNFDRDCTIDNINLLKPEIRTKLYEIITKKQQAFQEQKEAIEKN